MLSRIRVVINDASGSRCEMKGVLRHWSGIKSGLVILSFRVPRVGCDIRRVRGGGLRRRTSGTSCRGGVGSGRLARVSGCGGGVWCSRRRVRGRESRRGSIGLAGRGSPRSGGAGRLAVLRRGWRKLVVRWAWMLLRVSAGAKMHTLRHLDRADELAVGLTDYKETTCNHSTTWRGDAGRAGR